MLDMYRNAVTKAYYTTLGIDYTNPEMIATSLNLISMDSLTLIKELIQYIDTIDSSELIYTPNDRILMADIIQFETNTGFSIGDLLNQYTTLLNIELINHLQIKDINTVLVDTIKNTNIEQGNLGNARKQHCAQLEINSKLYDETRIPFINAICLLHMFRHQLNASIISTISDKMKSVERRRKTSPV